MANRNRMNGSGVAIGDVDGDDRPDVFFAAMEAQPRLYRNLGDWVFEEATQAAGLEAAPRWSTGAVFADVDGDADLDLFVTVLTGPNVLYLNDGRGRFEARLSGVESSRGSMGAAFGDTDGDGDLDLYVTNYKRIAARDTLSPDRLLFDNLVGPDGEVVADLQDHFRVDELDGAPLRLELGEEDQFYLNDGSGGFQAAGPDWAERDWGLAVALQDLTGDGRPDLYVANDFESPDYFRPGGGAESGPQVGHTPNSSMSVAVGDVNRDGLPDFFVPDMLSPDPASRRFQAGTAAPVRIRPGDLSSVPQYMQNGLFMNLGGGHYAEVARAFGVAATEWSWGARFLDVDLDGWQDLVITTGHSFDVQDVDAQLREREAIRRVRSVEAFRALILDYPRLELPNVTLRNVGGVRFERADWGFGDHPDIAHGMAFGDLDGDGDLDVVINRLNGPAGVFRNEASAPRVAVRFRADGPNPYGIGISVNGEEITAGGGYLSGSEAVVTLPADEDSLVLVYALRGRAGGIRARPNRLYEITEPVFSVHVGDFDSFHPPGPVWDTLSAPTEQPFDDRTLQPLLRRSLASGGAHLAVRGDTLLMGPGRGGRPVGHTAAGGLFQAARPASGDWTDVALRGSTMLAAESGYETGAAGALLTLDADLQEIRREPLPFSATGPMAVSRDGTVFVGARTERGRYPLTAPSLLVPGGPLDAGLATGAEFADFDGDGDDDLAVAAEWGPVRLYRNDGDTWTETGLLDIWTGLWQDVVWTDWDGDGLQDVVALNWGWNSYLGAPDQNDTEVRLYHGDFDGNGTYDLVEAEYRHDIRGWSPLIDFNTLRSAVPVLARRVTSWHAYAGSTVEDLFGPDLEYLAVNTLASTVFLNRGDRFEPEALPAEVQWAPANAATAGDGELVIAQNFFRVFPESTVRQDAGRGLRITRQGVEHLGVFGDQRDVVLWQGRIVFSRQGTSAAVLR